MYNRNIKQHVHSSSVDTFLHVLLHQQYYTIVKYITHKMVARSALKTALIE